MKKLKKRTHFLVFMQTSSKQPDRIFSLEEHLKALFNNEENLEGFRVHQGKSSKVYRIKLPWENYFVIVKAKSQRPHQYYSIRRKFLWDISVSGYCFGDPMIYDDFDVKRETEVNRLNMLKSHNFPVPSVLSSKVDGLLVLEYIEGKTR